MTPLNPVITAEDEEQFLEIHKGGALLFRMGEKAVRRLEFLVRDGLKAIPHRGLEIGGLLIGTSDGLPDSAVTVKDILPVQIEYLFGPAFRPSENDRKTFEDALRSYRTDAGWRVIGYYRSHLSGAVSPRPEDEQVLGWLFDSRESWMLLVEASRFERSVANFYARPHERTLRQVHRFVLLDGSSPPDKPLARPAPQALKPALPSVPQLLLEAAPVAARSQKRDFAIVSFALIVLLAAFVLGRFSKPQKTESTVLIGMRIEEDASGLKVKWNSASATVSKAVRGSLIIVGDEEGDRRIELDSTQLRTGTFAYTPVHSDLTFLMMVYQTKDIFIAETRSIHRNNPIAAVRKAGPPEAAPEYVYRTTVPPPRKRTPPSRRLRSGTPAARTPLSPLVADTAKPPQELEPPPKLNSTTPSAQGAIESFLVTPGINLKHDLIPRKPVTFSAAVPVRRVNPAVPPGARSLIHDEAPVNVKVRVEVDAEGNVEKAYPVEAGSSGPGKLLAPHAVQAAKLWRFKPALRDGAPVASETVLVFQFAKQSRF